MNTARQDAYPDLGRDLRFFPLGVEEPKVLTRAEIDTYNKRGYLFPFDVFDEAEIGEIRGYFDGLLADALASGWGSYEITNWHKTYHGVWRTSSPIRSWWPSLPTCSARR